MAGSHIATFPAAPFGKSARSRGLAVKTAQAAGAAVHPCSPRLLMRAKGSVRRLRGALRRALLTAGGSRFRGSEQESSINFKAQLKGFGNLNGRGRMTSIAIAAFAWLF